MNSGGCGATGKAYLSGAASYQDGAGNSNSTMDFLFGSQFEVVG